MDAIVCYNSDSEDDAENDETTSAADGIKIVEGSSVTLKPTDFFGLGDGEDDDEPASKKKRADNEENTMVMVQGNAVKIPNTDFWKDITHKQIVFMNNQSITKPEQINISKKNSNSLFVSSSSNSNTTSVLKQNTKKLPITSVCAATMKSCAVPLPQTVQFVSLIQPSCGGLPVLNIVPSTQTNAPFVLNTTAVQSFSSQTTHCLTQPLLQSVQNSIRSSRVEPINMASLSQVKQTGACVTSSSSGVATTNVIQASSILPTRVMLNNDGTEKTPEIQTFLLPATGNQPAKLIQLFPAKSASGQNLVKQNMSGVPTSVPQPVSNPIIVRNLHQVLSSQVQVSPSLIPLIKLKPVSEHTALTVPVSGQTTPLTTQVAQTKPHIQVHGGVTSDTCRQKPKSSTPNQSELLRLLQSPLVTSPNSLQTSTLLQKPSEAHTANENGLEQVSSGVKKDKLLTERINSLLSVHYLAQKEQLFQVSDKMLCYMNKSDVKRKPPTRIERSFVAHKSMVNRVKWNCPRYSHLLLSASMDGVVKVFNVHGHYDTNMLLQVLTHHSKAVKDAEWSADGKSVLSCSYDQSAVVADIETGKRICKLHHDSFVSCGKFHPFLEKNVVTGSNNLLQTWDIRTPDTPVRVFKYKDKMGQVQDIMFCAEGQQLFSASGLVSRDSADRNIMAWDYSTGAILSNQIFQERYSCTRLKLHPCKDRFLSQTQGGYIAMFSTKRPYEMVWSKRYEGHKMEGYDVGFDISADGSVVVSGSADGILYCYSNLTGKLWRTLRTDFDVCLDTAFHPILPSTVACCSTTGQIKIFH